MITVVMASYLGKYSTAADDREYKFIRAIKSLQQNTYQDWELQVISDGCDITEELVKEFANDSRIKCTKIPKQTKWSGTVRNTGIKQATYPYVCYLDTDDMLDSDHLQIIVDNIKDNDWIWFNDLRYDTRKEKFVENYCDINKLGRCGTSNLAHKKEIALWLEKGDYGHDWQFIKELKKASKKYAKVETPSYLVCHVPGLYDV